jgi:phenylalanyl-tRNA synthetase beta chain
MSLLDLKGDIEQLTGVFGCEELRFATDGLPGYYQPGLAGRVEWNGKSVARFGEVDRTEAEKWKFRGPVFLAEVFLEHLYARPKRVPQAGTLSRYPAVERDFSVVLPDEVRFEAVCGEIDRLKIPELVSLRPLEIFRGGTIRTGHYSLLLRVTLQSSESTLTEAELNEWSARIMQALEQSLGATIRMSN